MGGLVCKSLTCCALFVAAASVLAQQSVTAALDTCIRAEQRESTGLGGVLGGLLGLGVGAGERDSGSSGLRLRVGLGAGAGAALGLASAHFYAVERCFRKHPDWMPASQISAREDFIAAALQAGWRREDGLWVQISSVELPATARPDSRLQLNARFLVLTPDGAEARVLIERLLFVTVEGKEHPLPMPALASEERVFAPGGHHEQLQLPIPANAPLGVSYRVEFRLSPAGGAASRASASVRVI